MKSLHRGDLWAWSRFDEARNLDFNSIALIRRTGNVLIDPLELSVHDLAHLNSLGGAKTIIITNSEHLRAAKKLAHLFGATIFGPQAEAQHFDKKLEEGNEPVPGLIVYELHGSKTPGELALVLDGTTLITGDMIRGQHAGRLNLLPEGKLRNREMALKSVKKLIDRNPSIDTVLVGDGWSVFENGKARLTELLGPGVP